MKRLLALVWAMFLLTCVSQSQNQKKDDKAAAIRTAIQGKSYIFNAQTMMPATGRTRQLTSQYTLAVNKDTVTSDLPYFGRAYTAPIDATSSPLQFRSTNNTYTIGNTKKGGWDVDIKFKDAKEVQNMSLSISKDGYAVLTVTSTNRQTISFNGVIQKK